MPPVRSIPVLACCLAVALMQPANAQHTGLVADATCDRFVGAWSWFFGGMATFEADGTGVWRSSPEAAAGRTADWTCDPGSGVYSVYWEQGIVDSVTVAADDRSLAGSNQHGLEVSASRYDPAAAAAPAPAGGVEPVLVGTWELEVRLPSPQGPLRVLWMIGADGRYSFDAGHLSHAGTIEAEGGQWTLEAETADWRDGGSYELNDWTTLVATGVGGTGRWHRLEPELVLETVAMNADQVPRNLPQLTVDATAVARGWRDDAALVWLELDHADAQKREVRIELRFSSPSSGGGLVLTVSPEGTRFFEHRATNWGGGELPYGFIDLPEAWSIARQHGVLPPLGRADLRIYHPQDREPVLAWALSSMRQGRRSGITIDAADGNVLEGDLTGYIADYNASWERAVAGLRRLFERPPPPPSPSFDFDCCSSGSSSSSSSSDSSSGYSPSSTGLQNAWSAGDMGAYDRIQNGTATWDDKSRYGY